MRKWAWGHLCECEWQRQRGDEWMFGAKRRGIVRWPIAEIYFDEESDSPLGGWKWMVFREDEATNQLCVRGNSISLQQAIWDAEKEMGLTPLKS